MTHLFATLALANNLSHQTCRRQNADEHLHRKRKSQYTTRKIKQSDQAIREIKQSDQSHRRYINTMGRILDAIRRKRASTPTSTSSDSFNLPVSLANASQDEEIDKENANSSIGNKCRRHEALPLGKREVLVDGREDELCIEVTLSDSKSTDDDKERDDASVENVNISDKQGDCSSSDGDKSRSGFFETNDSSSLDEFSSVGDGSDEHAVASISDSTTNSNDVASITAISVSELTEVSDDGVLRDDEGNPIDPNEAEENMLRDDEGNIIDPKTLVVRDFLLDLSCESDEYYDDSGEHIDPKELISCIGNNEVLTPAVTDSSTQSEGDDADNEAELHVCLLHTDTEDDEEVIGEEEDGSFPSARAESKTENEERQQLHITTSSKPPHCDAETYEDLETQGRRNNNCSSISSRRRRRRGYHRSISGGNDEYIHIMFNNRFLSTLVEESMSPHQSSNAGDSGDEADDESHGGLSPRSNSSGRSKQRSSRARSGGSFDEKFIRARWEYSLQVMKSGSMGNGAVIDVSLFDVVSSLCTVTASLQCELTCYCFLPITFSGCEGGCRYN